MSILKKTGIVILKISVSFLLLFFLFKQVDLNSLSAIIKNSNKLFIGLAFLVNLFIYFFCFLRWKMLLETAKIKLPVQRLVSAFSGGVFFNFFLPSTIGGDFVRGADIGYHSKKNSSAAATVLLDRLSGFIGMSIVALTAIIFGRRLINDLRIFFVVYFLIVLLAVITLCIFNDFVYNFFGRLLSSRKQTKIWQGLKNVGQEMRGFKRHKSVIAKNLFLSIIIQFIAPLAGYLIMTAFHLKVNIIYFFIFMPVIGAVTVLPISIGGLGVRDYITVLLFTSIGLGKNFAFALSLLTSFFLLVYSGIGGLIYVLTLHNRRVQFD